MQSELEIQIGQYFEPSGNYASTRSKRFKGLARIALEQNPEPLIFENCRSIHTFGMKFDLKVVFLDLDNRVLGSRNVPPRRIVFAPKGTHTIVEIPIH